MEIIIGCVVIYFIIKLIAAINRGAAQRGAVTETNPQDDKIQRLELLNRQLQVTVASKEREIADLRGISNSVEAREKEIDKLTRLLDEKYDKLTQKDIVIQAKNAEISQLKEKCRKVTALKKEIDRLNKAIQEKDELIQDLIKTPTSSKPTTSAKKSIGHLFKEKGSESASESNNDATQVKAPSKKDMMKLFN